MLDSLLQYIHQGAHHSTGAYPIGNTLDGHTVYEHFGLRYDMKGRTGNTWGKAGMGGLTGALMGGVGAAVMGGSWGDIGTASATAGFVGATMGGIEKLRQGGKIGGNASWMGALGAVPVVGMSGYFIYQGYKENGLTGARDAAVWDIATNAAVRKFGYKQLAHGELAIGATKNAIVSKGLLSHGVRFLGAGIGAQIGQSIGDSIGLPGASIAGAFAGAFVGAAPVKFMASHPFIAAGAMAVGGLAATGYGAYEVLKMGYAQKQSRKGIQTAGDLAAFNTMGANTMRSRAVQAIQKSHTNARQALGMEANFLAYPSRSYHSPYR
jgi:hypothetical protein